MTAMPINKDCLYFETRYSVLSIDKKDILKIVDRFSKITNECIFGNYSDIVLFNGLRDNTLKDTGTIFEDTFNLVKNRIVYIKYKQYNETADIYFMIIYIINEIIKLACNRGKEVEYTSVPKDKIHMTDSGYWSIQ